MTLVDKNLEDCTLQNTPFFSIRWTDKKPCKVVKVVDGDSIHCAVHLGLGDPSQLFIIRVRLFGIDTPELRCSNITKKAIALTAKIFVESCVLGKICYLQAHGPDKYGRTLGTLYLERDDCVSVNQLLLDLCLADEY